MTSQAVVEDELRKTRGTSSSSGNNVKPVMMMMGSGEEFHSKSAAFASSAASTMDDSCMTGPTETGSISEDESLGWFGGITADIKTLAVTIKETAGGVASFVQRSALAVASEIAHLEEEELAHQMERSAENYEQQHQYDDNIVLRLPWEVPTCSSSSNNNGEEDQVNCYYQEDEQLKAKIRALSAKEDTFLRPYSAKDVGIVDGSTLTSSSSSSPRPPFVLDEPRIRLVRRMLNLDEKLASMHARLSGRSDVKEAVFWQNYFFNCELTREEYFLLQPPPSLTSPPPPATPAQPVSLQDPQQQMPMAELESFDEAETEGEGSFIEIPSPPASQKSVGSLVVVAPAGLDVPP